MIWPSPTLQEDLITNGLKKGAAVEGSTGVMITIPKSLRSGFDMLWLRDYNFNSSAPGLVTSYWYSLPNLELRIWPI